MKIGIVGSGPAGLYAARRILLKSRHSCINLIDCLSHPYGLLKTGVAPDHPEIKSPTFLKEIILSTRLSTFGNVTIGKDLSISDLLKTHDVTVIATGVGKSKKIDIAGSELLNSFTSSEIFNWYNNYPQAKMLCLKKIKNVLIIGQGNVALDIARIFSKHPDNLERFDISNTVLQTLRSSAIKEIDIVGRRGPLQTSFTSSEFREICQHSNIFDISSDLSHFRFMDLPGFDRREKRLYELLYKNRECRSSQSDKKIKLLYYLKPLRIIGCDGKVSEVVFEQMEDQNLIPKNAKEILSMNVIGKSIFLQKKYDMVISCIGFESSRLEINHESSENLFVCGWASTGAMGNLTSTLTDSNSIADTIIHNYSDLLLKSQKTFDLRHILREKGISFIDFKHNI